MIAGTCLCSGSGRRTREAYSIRYQRFCLVSRLLLSTHCDGYVAVPSLVPHGILIPIDVQVGSNSRVDDYDANLNPVKGVTVHQLNENSGSSLFFNSPRRSMRSVCGACTVSILCDTCLMLKCFVSFPDLALPFSVPTLASSFVQLRLVVIARWRLLREDT